MILQRETSSLIGKIEFCFYIPYLEILSFLEIEIHCTLHLFLRVKYIHTLKMTQNYKIFSSFIRNPYEIYSRFINPDFSLTMCDDRKK